MALREFNTREKLQALLDREIAGDRGERPDNNLLENALKLALGEEYTATELEVFGYPRSNSQYLFFVEYSGLQPPFIHVRKPLTGHDIELLEATVPLVLERTRNAQSKHTRFLIVGDQVTGEAFARHVDGDNWKSVYNNPCGVFHMTAAQREALMKENTDTPPGFTFEPVDVERDGDTVHKMWKYGVSPEITKYWVEE